MRELLFRGKRKDNGEWVYGGYARLSNHACFSHNLKYTHFIMQDESIDIGIGALVDYEVIPETVGQYTGLDVNGKKIFEGDIHERENRFFVVKYGKYRDCETGEEGYGWYFEYTHIKGCEGFNGTESGYANIIGNIHDNFEFIKGGADE